MYHMNKDCKNIFFNKVLSACSKVKNGKYHTVCEIDLLFCFCVNRRDCECDASAVLTDLTQQNTGKSSPLLYPALPADL